MKYICSICGYVYDEDREDTPFSDLSDSWVCPVCGATKVAFTPEQKPETVKSPKKSFIIEDDMKKLSAGELSALCSNLARGCEKQYKPEESALFQKIADYFAAATPPVENGEMSLLADLMQRDLNEGYPALRSAAVEDSDRGTQRICVWGEKVTNMLNTLMQRWAAEGDAFLHNTEVWVCSVCGFVYIGDKAPELCPVCKVPTWKFEKIERRASA